MTPAAIASATVGTLDGEVCSRLRDPVDEWARLLALSSTGGAVIAGRMFQGAAGATILACGLSLLTVANSGQAQIRAVSLWGAAAAVGAAAGPLTES